MTVSKDLEIAISLIIRTFTYTNPRLVWKIKVYCIVYIMYCITCSMVKVIHFKIIFLKYYYY